MCMENIKISIIVPIYNVENYIKRCMDSLVTQSFDDYEIIAVNDGTLDNSMAYVYELQKSYPNIIICEQENGGLSSARNTGVEHASGEYIMFCDSDDELQENCLQMLYDEVKRSDLDMLLYDAEYIVDEMAEQSRDNPYLRLNITERVCDGKSMLQELLNKKEYLASACLYLMRKRLWIDNNFKFYEKILHEDELFTPLAIIKCEKVEHKNWMIYKRHVREGSITTSNNMDKRMKGLGIVIKELIKFMNNDLGGRKENRLNCLSVIM